MLGGWGGVHHMCSRRNPVQQQLTVFQVKLPGCRGWGEG